MCKLDELRAKRKEIYEIAKRHKVNKLYVFGSCARKEETPDSDVDFIADFMPKTSFYKLIEFHDELESFLQEKIDVVSRNGIKPFIRENVLMDAVEL